MLPCAPPCPFLTVYLFLVEWRIGSASQFVNTAEANAPDRSRITRDFDFEGVSLESEMLACKASEAIALREVGVGVDVDCIKIAEGMIRQVFCVAVAPAPALVPVPVPVLGRGIRRDGTRLFETARAANPASEPAPFSDSSFSSSLSLESESASESESVSFLFDLTTKSENMPTADAEQASLLWFGFVED